jgi:hypothetical protein
MKRLLTLVPLLALFGITLVGCYGADTTTSKEEEEAFRNPPKEIPPENLKAMQKAREEGLRKAEEIRRKAGGG